MFTALGFGQKPQLGFPGAVSGRLRPCKTWRPIEQATMATATASRLSLFQLAHAYTVFARDGELMPLTILQADGRAPGPACASCRPKPRASARRCSSWPPARAAPRRRRRRMGYSVGGKTGTAHKQEGKRLRANKYRASFVGFAPVDDPRIVVAVMIDEPSNGKYYGGEVAAPVFSQVVQQTLRMLGVPPDLDVQPQIVAARGRGEPESF